MLSDTEDANAEKNETYARGHNQTAQSPTPEHPSERPLRADILIVDDQRINLVVATKMIEFRGYTAETAASGEKALELLRSGRYRLLLLDMQLPDMNGIEVVRRIRTVVDHGAENGDTSVSEVSDRHIPVVMLTAYADDSDHRESLEAGADAYLVKPLDQEKLDGILQRLSPQAPPQTDGGSGSSGDTGDRGATGGSVDTGESDSSRGPTADNDTSGPAVFDPAGLQARVGSSSLSQTVAKRFLESVSGYAAAVDNAVASGDLDELASAAHNLAGPAANVGAEALRALSKSIEAAASNGDWEQVHRHATRLHTELAAARGEIEQFTSDGPSQSSS